MAYEVQVTFDCGDPAALAEFWAAALDAEAVRLAGRGAVRVRRHEPGGIDSGFIVMQDPEGNEFCLD
jgi:hypothetical protein